MDTFLLFAHAGFLLPLSNWKGMGEMYRADDPARALCPSVGERNAGEPVPPPERYQHIDVIRGLALFGVLLVNDLSMFRIPLLEHILGHDASQWSIDAFTADIVAVALEFKAVTIFSFLFGAGVAIQAERARANRAGSAAFLARRFGWLFIFGVIHMLLIWDGDILALYAVGGLLLLPAVWLPRPVLLLLGALLIAMPNFVPLPLHLPVGEVAQLHIARAREIYGGGDVLSILRFRVFEARFLMVPLLTSILPRTTGLMLWGIAGWRSGVFRKPDEHNRTLSVTFVCAGAAAIMFPRVPIVVAAAYVSGLLLIVPLVRPSRLRGLAAVGQMALTNYLLQSLILGFVFYGYGFGLFGHVGSAAAAGIGILLYIVQVYTSSFWLQHFRFGPFEWLWRSLTYGYRQPMKRVLLSSATTAGQGSSIRVV